MRRLRQLRHRLRSVLQPGRMQEELDRELHLHLEQLTRESLDAGLDERDARREAGKAFGSLDLAREQCRDARRIGLLEDFIGDVRYGGRVLLRAPAFAITAIVSLAVGLGVTTGVFSVADAVLWRLLPVASPQQLVFVKAAGNESVGGAPPYRVFERLRDDTSAFSGMAAFASDELRVEVDGQLEQVNGQVASGSYFEVLGLAPAAGRLATHADEQARLPVAVVSHAYAQRRFGGVHQALGHAITFRDTRFTIIGVTPAGFPGLIPGRSIDVTLPITFEGDLLKSTDTWWFEAVARVASGTSMAAATAQVDAIFQTFMDGHAAGSPTATLRRAHFDHLVLTPAAQGLDNLRRRFRTPLYVLVLVSAAVLCITCLNLGNLLLVRGAARERELAVRIATGAGAGRLCRQLLTETLLLFGLGGLLGLLVARGVVDLLTGFFAIGRSPILLDVRWDWRVGAFTVSVTLLAGLLTGLWPALRLLRSSQVSSMQAHGSRLAGHARLSRVARFSVVSQVALSLVLLVASILAIRTMANLRSENLGFRPGQVLTMSIDPIDIGPRGQDQDSRMAFWRETLRRVRALPGVRSASVSVLTPLSGRDRGRLVTVAGYEPPAPQDRAVKLNLVSEGYFETFGIDVRAGRVLAATDTGTAPVAVVNESGAAKFFGGRTPIGETLDFGEFGAFQVVGVVANHKHRSIREPVPPMAFTPIWRLVETPTRVTLSLASSEPPAALARRAAEEVRTVHSRTLVSDVLAIDEQIDSTLIGERLLSTLATALALVAIGLAAIGLHGVLSDVVSRRRVEFGVRMALGAAPVQVAWSVYREVLWQVAIGIAIGIPVSLAIAPRAANLLYGLAPDEPWTYVVSVGLLVLIALLAAGVPVRRAWSIAPSEALRQN